MNWIKTSESLPNIGEEVEVKFGNGNTGKALMNKRWWSYMEEVPKEDKESEIIEWRRIES